MKVTFNAGWTVRTKTTPFAQMAGGGDAPREITLPHDALISAVRGPEVAGEGHTGYFPDGAFEYTKEFTAPEEWRDQRVSLEFQGVYRDAMVYVNGVYAGQRPNGYTPFRVSLDPYLEFGQVNSVRVDARAHQDSRWYTGAGIYRDVLLEVTDLVHIGASGVRIRTPEIDDAQALVVVTTPVHNESIATATVRVSTQLIGPDGTPATSDSMPVTVRAGETVPVHQRLYVRSPKSWSTAEPDLYTAKTVLEVGSHTVHAATTRFGIRTVSVDPSRGLRINGEAVKLRGACIHHDNGLLGAAAFSRAEERRIELLKTAGFNAIRSAHNPLSPAMLDACDRLGMLVMDELTDVWTEAKSNFDYSLAFPEWWERDVEALVAKDYNHPSVIFYSIGNEIFETGSLLGSEWGRALSEKIRSLDRSRLITNGINPFVSVLSDVVADLQREAAEAASSSDGGVNGIMSLDGFMDRLAVTPLASGRTEASFGLLDVAGMNYSEARYELDAELFPNRVIVGTETFPPRVAENWRRILANNHVIGEFTWTGWDYLGEVGLGRTQYADADPEFQAPYPWISAWSGDIDITGHRRPISYYRETVFGLRSDPYIAVLRPEHHGRTPVPSMWGWSDSESSWSWGIDTGAPIAVEVYADGDEVELLLNGRGVGRERTGTTKPFVTEFDVQYEPGTLEAVVYRNGREAGRTSLRSARGNLHLAVKADRTDLVTHDGELAFITIELQDENGTVASDHDVAVTVTVDGAGVLQALGSARPATEESFAAGTFTTFDGRALAIVRPHGTGSITVSVSADGIDMASAVLTATANPE